MQAAPLWDASTREFVGLLTVTDFITILHHYSITGTSVSSLTTRSIASILTGPEGAKMHHSNGFDAADANADLLQCCRLLNGQCRDFLPIILPQDSRVLSIITYTSILEYLVTTFREQRRLFDDSIHDLNIGTYENILTAELTSTLSEVLQNMAERNLSAVPVVDADGVVVSLYSRR